MTQRRYSTPDNPTAEFEAMRPAFNAIRQMMERVKPRGPDYLVLEAVTTAMNTAAYHFLRDPYFFGSKPPRS